MRRIIAPLLLSLAAAGCVSVEGLPSPKGALKPGQRLVVLVNQAPGPWIIADADSKAEAAAKISPLGFVVQSVQNERILSVSKDLQQYMPRPHYAVEFQEPLLKALRATLSTAAVQTGPEAGIPAAQLLDWNRAKDQLDWRLKYYFPDPEGPPARDYSRILTLDDAVVLDVNVSFGTDANDDGKVFPVMSADARAYHGDTGRLIWEHEDVASDQSSSSGTLTDFRVAPWELTARIEKLAPGLGATTAVSFAKAFGLMPSTSAPAGVKPASGGGLVDMSVFSRMASSTAAAASSSTTSVVLSTTAVGVASSGAIVSSATAATPPSSAPDSSTAPATSPPSSPPK